MAMRRAWQRKLNAGGYLGMRWPKEWGGRGATGVEEAILAEELANADAPEVPNSLGLTLCAPALIHHGTEEQRRRYIPAMLNADEIWCQGFSEPGAGSDLASLRCRAELEGDHFVINGQKCWTTYGRTPTGSSCSRERTRTIATAASRSSSSTSTPRASRCDRSSRSPARASSARCSSRTRRCRARTSSASSAKAGRSR